MLDTATLTEDDVGLQATYAFASTERLPRQR